MGSFNKVAFLGSLKKVAIMGSLIRLATPGFANKFFIEGFYSIDYIAPLAFIIDDIFPGLVANILLNFSITEEFPFVIESTLSAKGYYPFLRTY